MKREILFRGKRIDNDKWIYGLPIEYEYGISITNINSLHHIDGAEWNFNDIQIIPETIGQFTGLTDKNEVKIFEGDVVKDWAGTRVVKFEIYDNYQGYDLEPDDIDCEIIGNIHDNPEFLNQ